ncbi:MAG TPA: phosphoribosylformylglycinamidine synthase subunit PurS [Actinomycetota bacterium]
MRFRVRLLVTLKEGLLDPQGKAVESALPALGWDNVSDVGVGKYLRFEVEAEGEEAARKQTEQMATRFLTNPVIEDHAILEVERAEPATATGPEGRR